MVHDSSGLESLNRKNNRSLLSLTLQLRTASHSASSFGNKSSRGKRINAEKMGTLFPTNKSESFQRRQESGHIGSGGGITWFHYDRLDLQDCLLLFAREQQKNWPETIIV